MDDERWRIYVFNPRSGRDLFWLLNKGELPQPVRAAPNLLDIDVRLYGWSKTVEKARQDARRQLLAITASSGWCCHEEIIRG